MRRWPFVGGVDRFGYAVAAAGCYSDCVPEGSGQVRCQEAEFFQIRVCIGEHFRSVHQQLGPQTELNLFGVVSEA
ncbi:hypothetical protein ADK49_15035 [Streptomyces sp. WM6349]|nr:hypothetical protein ADK49_15035 [Streptomyces sp. WM6349]KOV54828.1 hypothetical protein ADK98_03085 [Streptomyces sp. H036]